MQVPTSGALAGPTTRHVCMVSSDGLPSPQNGRCTQYEDLIKTHCPRPGCAAVSTQEPAGMKGLVTRSSLNFRRGRWSEHYPLAEPQSVRASVRSGVMPRDCPGHCPWGVGGSGGGVGLVVRALLCNPHTRGHLVTSYTRPFPATRWRNRYLNPNILLDGNHCWTIDEGNGSGLRG